MHVDEKKNTKSPWQRHRKGPAEFQRSRQNSRGSQDQMPFTVCKQQDPQKERQPSYGHSDGEQPKRKTAECPGSRRSISIVTLLSRVEAALVRYLISGCAEEQRARGQSSARTARQQGKR